MDWFSIAVMGAVGAAGGVLGALLAWPLRNRSKNVHQMISVIAVVGSIQLGNQLVLPEVRAWRAQESAEEFLEANPFLAVLVRADPNARKEFLEVAADSARVGASPEEARARGFAWGQAVSARILTKHLPTASDEALLQFVRTQVRVADHLAKRDVDSCHAFLFGAAAGQSKPVDEQQMPADMVQALQDSMTAVILTSIEQSGTRQEVTDGDTLLSELLQALIQEHGESFTTALASLEQPESPDVDTALTCLAGREMFRAAVEMPQPKASQMIRVLVTE